MTPDPLDIQAHPWFVRRLVNQDRFSSRWTRKIALGVCTLFPLAARRRLRIPLFQTAEAVAALAQAYLALFRLTRDPGHLRTAERWLGCLREMRLADYAEFCWGFPFDWQSAVLVPARSPLLYDSWQAGEAFAEHFEVAGNTGSHEIAVSACRGMLTIFNRTVDDSQHLSLSYTPHDHLRVYNVNALGGGLMCKLGSGAGEPRLASSGRRMLNWVVAHQSEDGSWSYHSAGNGEHESIIDH